MDTIAKHSIKLTWKSFRVHLPSLELWLRSNAGLEYVGNSADTSGLNLWFSKEPSEQIKLRVQNHWENITEANEDSRFKSQELRARAVLAAQENIIFKSWDQMVPAERKLQQGRPLTDEDKDALVTLYEQA